MSPRFLPPGDFSYPYSQQTEWTPLGREESPSVENKWFQNESAGKQCQAPSLCGQGHWFSGHHTHSTGPWAGAGLPLAHFLGAATCGAFLIIGQTLMGFLLSVSALQGAPGQTFCQRNWDAGYRSE